jgi:hypothetical protein
MAGPDARDNVPAVADALLSAIVEHGLPNRFSPADLEVSGTASAAVIGHVGRLWMGDLVEAVGRADIRNQLPRSVLHPAAAPLNRRAILLSSARYDLERPTG